ncbi:amidohydrolase family protein [Paenibacillus sp. NEAU-GSW1]|uniref:amidohydrolase family protein n=1 Tax=Paenibacillus sp. NEAU-GSW1 TaxID=2682486 RepID=UPI0012E15EDF|nr:amidohydrolase family protein [Paenibacillus sp. NEAU-GSW1]MUT64670.1 amidohydrolase family protein [Paenibacillus sp. NEAU-GSW1]
MKLKTVRITLLALGCIVVIGAALLISSGNWPFKGAGNPEINAVNEVAERVEKLKQAEATPTLEQLADAFEPLGLIDVHNHDASASRYSNMMSVWEKNNVDKVVLFGDVSEPSAIDSDAASWSAYQLSPDQFLPFFSGFDLHDEGSLDVIRDNLEKGYFGLGEIAAASSFSPIVSKVAWKANDPMDGFLPQIYDLIATYKAPILVHIDPPNGDPIVKLEEALAAHPNTTFIFGHMNVYNSPEELDRLLGKYPNLYADFFAGFAVYSAESGRNPEPFISIMKKYPDRFMLGTDSGYGIGSELQAIDAMYRILYLLDDPALAKKIAHDNMMALIEAQPATKTQLEAIQKLASENGKSYNSEELTKLEAGKILAEARKG